MSSYVQNTKHPSRNKFEPAEWIDDYFGPNNYGVKFEGEEPLDARAFEWQTNDKPVPQEVIDKFYGKAVKITNPDIGGFWNKEKQIYEFKEREELQTLEFPQIKFEGESKPFNNQLAFLNIIKWLYLNQGGYDNAAKWRSGFIEMLAEELNIKFNGEKKIR